MLDSAYSSTVPNALAIAQAFCASCLILAVVTHTVVTHTVVLANPEGYLISGILSWGSRARDVPGHTVITTPTVKSDATTDGTNC